MLFTEVSKPDTATFWSLITGCIRAGHKPFLISSRNSAVAVAHLLKATGCHYVLVSTDSGTKTLAEESIEILKKEETAFEVKLGDVPDFDDLFGDDLDPDIALPKLENVDLEATALIAHSSGTYLLIDKKFRVFFKYIIFTGSTSFPKPRILTHKNLIQWALQACMSTLFCRCLMNVLINLSD